MSEDPPNTYPRVFVDKAKPEWKGQRCRVEFSLPSLGPDTAMISFRDLDTYTICPIRCTRKVP